MRRHLFFWSVARYGQEFLCTLIFKVERRGVLFPESTLRERHAVHLLQETNW